VRVLVTGAGKIGARLLPRLEARGVTGIVLQRRARAAPSPSWQVVRADLTDPATLVGVCGGCDTVLHLAALTHSNSERLYEQVNAGGTLNLLAEAKRAGIRRFIHVSTRAIAPEGGAYSRSKAHAERLVCSGGIPWTILRPAEVYGTGSEGLGALIERVRRGRLVPVVGDGSARVSPVFVDDIVEAMSAAVRVPAECRTVVLAGPEELTYSELVSRLAAYYGSRARPVHVPAAALRAFARALALLRLRRPPLYVDQVSRLLSQKTWDVAAAAEALGFRPRSLEAGLAALAEG
jgi:nucleoside-diphosphate-sugar epimerase